jgi:CheY-like chemotaxis protein
MISDALAQLQPAPSDADRRQSILIVDDDQVQVEVLSHRLQKQGFITVLAYEGRAGLAKAREHRPDLVLLDLRLPDLDGFSVCEELVDSPDTCDIPVIIVSGSDQPDVVRTSRAAGCEFFVRKPYDPNALLTLIEHALKRGFDWEV